MENNRNATQNTITNRLTINTTATGPLPVRIKQLTLALCFALNAPLALADQLMSPIATPMPNQQATIAPVNKSLKPIKQPRIQIAILLDTSSSMSGLINQTRNQLWQFVNEFSGAKQNGLTPILEVALFEYGNSGNTSETGFVRQLTGFTRELDSVSEGLFSLTTNGGAEYCGYAIDTAVKSLQWSQSSKDIKTIFIAGNEPFTQGPIDFREAISLASKSGISVNTIHAGQHQAGIEGSWKQAALLAGGDFMSIDANQQIVHIDAPQDQKIAELNAQLNQTYIPYGAQGEKKIRRQMKQDEESAKISVGLLAKRAKSKSSSYYNNASWDMVDAIAEGELEDADIAAMPVAELPAEMRTLEIGERKQYIVEKQQARAHIKEEIAKLSAKRDDHIASTRRSEASSAPSMSDALIGSVKKVAKKKQFELSQPSGGKAQE